MRILVLGAGFGGLEVTTRLAEELGDDLDVVLIDQVDGFVFGFSKLEVMFRGTVAGAVMASLPRPGQARCAFRADQCAGYRARCPAGRDRCRAL